jgi:hypothetical protein
VASKGAQELDDRTRRDLGQERFAVRAPCGQTVIAANW